MCVPVYRFCCCSCSPHHHHHHPSVFIPSLSSERPSGSGTTLYDFLCSVVFSHLGLERMATDGEGEECYPTRFSLVTSDAAGWAAAEAIIRRRLCGVGTTFADLAGAIHELQALNRGAFDPTARIAAARATDCAGLRCAVAALFPDPGELYGRVLPFVVERALELPRWLPWLPTLRTGVRGAVVLERRLVLSLLANVLLCNHRDMVDQRAPGACRTGPRCAGHWCTLDWYLVYASDAPVAVARTQCFLAYFVAAERAHAAAAAAGCLRAFLPGALSIERCVGDPAAAARGGGLRAAARGRGRARAHGGGRHGGAVRVRRRRLCVPRPARGLRVRVGDAGGGALLDAPRAARRALRHRRRARRVPLRRARRRRRRRARLRRADRPPRLRDRRRDARPVRARRRPPRLQQGLRRLHPRAPTRPRTAPSPSAPAAGAAAPSAATASSSSSSRSSPPAPPASPSPTPPTTTTPTPPASRTSSTTSSPPACASATSGASSPPSAATTPAPSTSTSTRSSASSGPSEAPSAHLSLSRARLSLSFFVSLLFCIPRVFCHIIPVSWLVDKRGERLGITSARQRRPSSAQQ